MKANGVTGRVVYPTLSYISHSCVCNARYRSIIFRKSLLFTFLSKNLTDFTTSQTESSLWFFDKMVKKGTFSKLLSCTVCHQLTIRSKFDLKPKFQKVKKSPFSTCHLCMDIWGENPKLEISGSSTVLVLGNFTTLFNQVHNQ